MQVLIFERDNILKKVLLPETNHVLEKSSNIKTKDSSIIENKYKNLNLLSIINSEHLVNNIVFK